LATWGKMLYPCLEAAEQLSAAGVSCEVIDLRSLRPMDHQTVVCSVHKTHRLVIVHETWPYGGPGAELVDRVQREAFDVLDAPILRCTGRDAPMPYNKTLESLTIPDTKTVMAAVRAVMAY
jgi:pyruvate dehydrogenase E1 component beta subunit